MLVGWDLRLARLQRGKGKGKGEEGVAAFPFCMGKAAVEIDTLMIGNV